MSLQFTFTRDELTHGKGLKRSGRFLLLRNSSGAKLGYTDDITYAMAYRIYAKSRHVTIDVEDCDA